MVRDKIFTGREHQKSNRFIKFGVRLNPCAKTVENNRCDVYGFELGMLRYFNRKVMKLSYSSMT